MNARPRAVTVIGSVFVVFGCVALPVSLLRLFSAVPAADLAESYMQRPVESAIIPIVQLLAIVLHLQAEHGMRFLHVRQLAPEQPEQVQYTLWRATLVRAGIYVLSAGRRCAPPTQVVPPSGVA